MNVNNGGPSKNEKQNTMREITFYYHGERSREPPVLYFLIAVEVRIAFSLSTAG